MYDEFNKGPGMRETIIKRENAEIYVCAPELYKELVNDIKERKRRRDESNSETILSDGDTRGSDCMALVLRG
jgi:hypothetical protein